MHSALFLRFIHVVVTVVNFSLLYNILLYEFATFDYSCFCWWISVWNNAVLNIFVYVFWCTWTRDILENIAWREIAGCRVCPWSIFLNNIKVFPKVVIPVYPPIRSRLGVLLIPCPCQFLVLWDCLIFVIQVVWNCILFGFNIHSLIINEVKNIFMFRAIYASSMKFLFILHIILSDWSCFSYLFRMF